MAEKADDKKEAKKGGESVKAGESSPKGAEDKKSKQKEVISKLAAEQKPVEGAPAMPRGKSKIKINVSFELDNAVKSKLPFLLGVLLLSTLAYVMLAKTGFSFTELFDFNRVSNNLEKLVSISFILFVVLYSLALALAAYFGNNLRSSNALLFSMLIIVPAGIAYFAETSITGLPDHHYTLVYVWLGFGTIMAALFGTLMESLSVGSIWSSLGRVILVLLILAVAFTYVKVGSDKELYLGNFISSVANLDPQLKGQVKESLSDYIEKLKLTEDQKSKMVKDPASHISKDSVPPLVRLQYASFRKVSVDSFTSADDRKYVSETIPATYDSLSSSEKQKLVDDTYSFLQRSETEQLVAGPVKATVPELQASLAELIRESETKPVESGDLADIRKELEDNSLFVQFEKDFEIYMALLVFSVLSLGTMVVRILSTLFCYGIAKILAM